jgi:hypothetical protein
VRTTEGRKSCRRRHKEEVMENKKEWREENEADAEA